MTTLSLSVESKADVIIEFDAIWRVAIDCYEKITMIKIQSLVEVNNVNEILNDIHERETKFKAHHHDNSKLNKFRTLVNKSLNFIEKAERYDRVDCFDDKKRVSVCSLIEINLCLYYESSFLSALSSLWLFIILSTYYIYILIQYDS